MRQLRERWQRHPGLVSWLLLAIGMVVIVAIAARDVGFTAPQWAVLMITTVALAGLCVWIVGWEEASSEEDEPN